MAIKPFIPPESIAAVEDEILAMRAAPQSDPSVQALTFLRCFYAAMDLPRPIATQVVRTPIKALREPTDKMIEAMAFQIAIRSTQGKLSPAEWETSPDKGFWRKIAEAAWKEGIDVAAGE